MVAGAMSPSVRKELAKVVLQQSRTARGLPPHKLDKVVNAVDDWLMRTARSPSEYDDISTLKTRFHAFVWTRHNRQLGRSECMARGS